MPTQTPPPVAPRTQTIHDVARHLGVSKTTVSKAFTGSGRISPRTREAVLAAAREMGFDLNPHAQRLSRGQGSDLVALFCPEHHEGATALKNRQIQRLLDTEGWDAPLYTSAPVRGSNEIGQVEALRRVRRLRPRALVCLTPHLQPATLEELRTYQAEGGVLVTYDNEISLPCDQMIFDRADNTYQSTRYLLDQGHREIGLFVVGVPDVHPYAAPRVTGFERAMAERGLTRDTRWYWQNTTGSEVAGVGLARQFLALPADDRPTAMCIINEGVAVGFMNQILRAGLRIPEDVSVISHDNLPASAYTIVPLTTVSHPIEEIAQGVARMVQTRLADPTLPPRREYACGGLVVRESVGPPPDRGGSV